MRFASLLACGLLLMADSALAANYNIDEVQAHGAWHSLNLTLGKERHVRAIEQSTYADSVFSVNATPGNCQRPWLEIRVALDAIQAESANWDQVPVDLLVDEGVVHSGQATYATERGDDGFYMRLALTDTDALLDDMRSGKLLRLRIHRAPEDYWFMVFNLDGADDALARMQRLCRTPASGGPTPPPTEPTGAPSPTGW